MCFSVIAAGAGFAGVGAGKLVAQGAAAVGRLVASQGSAVQAVATAAAAVELNVAAGGALGAAAQATSNLVGMVFGDEVSLTDGVGKAAATGAAAGVVASATPLVRGVINNVPASALAVSKDVAAEALTMVGAAGAEMAIATGNELTQNDGNDPCLHSAHC